MVEKNTLRSEIKKLLESYDAEVLERWSRECFINLKKLAAFSDAGNVMLFASTYYEPDTLKIIEFLLNSGKNVFLPKIVDYCCKVMSGIKIFSVDELIPGKYGILGPAGRIAVNPAEIDFILVPGAAFDKNNSRLGRGAGYYDRFLPQLKPECFKTGYCFSCQVVDSVPIEPHDVKMDCVVSNIQTVLEKL
ncbi:MAG: 5-formyltetrahydrofolate cyclo-ligase [Clostridiales bacterium]|jgi:5-formyltetrahydrofolate cyclo-ligase|nr:5-formyltetrahydrofolate cyclo-ligase [Clostridiales bacterium]